MGMTWPDDYLIPGIEPFHQEEAGIIYCGDCLEIMPLLTKKVNLIIIDPPYFLPAMHYQTRKQFSRNFSDLGILEHYFKDYFRLQKEIIRDDGTIYIFCDGQSYPLFYYHLYPIVKSLRPLIWDKMTSINGYHWRHQHELIMFADMPGTKPIPTGDGDILKYRAVKVDDRLHPAEKPIELLKSLIFKSSNEGDIVADFFLGGGSLAVAAKELGRKFIGVEISETYCQIAVKRLRQGVLKFE